MESRTRFENELAQVEWSVLRAHTERDGLILVADELDLVEVACRVVDDDADHIADWIREGRMGKPTGDQLADWNARPQDRFHVLIVQPYVLVQGPCPS